MVGLDWKLTLEGDHYLPRPTARVSVRVRASVGLSRTVIVIRGVWDGRCGTGGEFWVDC